MSGPPCVIVLPAMGYLPQFIASSHSPYERGTFTFMNNPIKELTLSQKESNPSFVTQAAVGRGDRKQAENVQAGSNCSLSTPVHRVSADEIKTISRH